VADKRMKKEMEALADRVFCPLWVDQLGAVGAWFDDFSQTEDEEVITLLNFPTH